MLSASAWPMIGRPVSGLSTPVSTIVDTGVLNPLTGLPIIGQALADNIRKFAYGANGNDPAPPCVQQGPYSPSTSPPSARQGQYPNVAAAASGSARRRK